MRYGLEHFAPFKKQVCLHHTCVLLLILLLLGTAEQKQEVGFSEVLLFLLPISLSEGTCDWIKVSTSAADMPNKHSKGKTTTNYDLCRKTRYFCSQVLCVKKQEA